MHWFATEEGAASVADINSLKRSGQTTTGAGGAAASESPALSGKAELDFTGRRYAAKRAAA